MPRVHKVKANKDYPDIGVKKGDTYYWWKLYHAPIQKSKTYPRPQQLTGSGFLRSTYDLNDSIAALGVEDMADGGLESITSDIESLREEQEDKLGNMEEYGLDQGDTGQMIQERIDALQEMQDTLEGVSMPDEEPEEPQAPGDEPAEPKPQDGAETPEFQAAHDAWEAMHKEWEQRVEAHETWETEHEDWEAERETALEEVQAVSYEGP